MNIHKNARLTFARRIELVRDIVEKGFTPCTAGAVHGVTGLTAGKWLGRYLAEGQAGLRDRSSKPKRSPRKIKPEKALAIVELRRRRLTQARIAASLVFEQSYGLMEGDSASSRARRAPACGLPYAGSSTCCHPVV